MEWMMMGGVTFSEKMQLQAGAQPSHGWQHPWQHRQLEKNTWVPLGQQ